MGKCDCDPDFTGEACAYRKLNPQIAFRAYIFARNSRVCSSRAIGYGALIETFADILVSKTGSK